MKVIKQTRATLLAGLIMQIASCGQQASQSKTADVASPGIISEETVNKLYSVEGGKDPKIAVGICPRGELAVKANCLTAFTVSLEKTQKSVLESYDLDIDKERVARDKLIVSLREQHPRMLATRAALNILIAEKKTATQLHENALEKISQSEKSINTAELQIEQLTGQLVRIVSALQKSSNDKDLQLQFDHYKSERARIQLLASDEGNRLKQLTVHHEVLHKALVAVETKILGKESELKLALEGLEVKDPELQKVESSLTKLARQKSTVQRVVEFVKKLGISFTEKEFNQDDKDIFDRIKSAITCVHKLTENP